MNISNDKVMLQLPEYYPFFGRLFLQTEVINVDWDDFLAGTDGVNIFINPTMIDKLDMKERFGLYVHELMHIMLLHLNRIGSRDKTLWNIATDYAVNGIIVTENKVKLPTGGLYKKEFSDMSAEKIYEKLLDSGSNEGRQPNNHSMWKPISQEQESIIRQKIESAIKSSNYGDVPECMRRYFKLFQHNEDWRNILIDYITTNDYDYSFNPIDRRFMGKQFILPDIYETGEKIDWIAIAIDTSGSITDKELNLYLSDIYSLLTCFDNIMIKLVFCDADQYGWIDLNNINIAQIKPQGGGGTSFIPVFNLIKNEPIPPKCLIYFTDLCGDFPSQTPDYNVLWMTKTDDISVPFGKIININE